MTTEIDVRQQTIDENFENALRRIQLLIRYAPDDATLAELRSALCSVMILFCEEYDVTWETDEFNYLLDRLEDMSPYALNYWLSCAREVIRAPREKFHHQPQPIELSKLAPVTYVTD